MKLSWLYFFKERLTGDRRPSVAAWLGSFLVPFFHSQRSFLLADKRLPCYVWVVAPGTQGKSPMDLRQIAQEIRVSGPLSPESFYASLNKKGIVAAENRWKIALTLCKLCELSKNVSVACQAIFAKYMYWFFFTSQMLMVIAFGQKSILKLLVSSVELRSHPETSSTDVWCFITLASGFRIALMCLTNQLCGSNIFSHVKGNENLREAKPIPFSRYNKRFAPWGERSGAAANDLGHLRLRLGQQLIGRFHW